jgi:integrase
MGTITERKRQDGTSAYTAQIRIKRGGRVLHTEAQTFEKRKAAELWLLKREAELANGLPHAPRTIRSLIESFITDQPKNSAVRSLLNLLGTNEDGQARYVLPELNVLELTTPQVLDFVKVRKLEVKPATLQFDLAQLRAVLNAAITESGIPLPIESFDAAVTYAKQKGWVRPSTRRERRLSLEEETRLMEHFSVTHPSLHMTTILQFALHSARRLEEITRLRWEDLDREKKTILVRDLKHPRIKQGHDRRARLTIEALNIIDSQSHTHDTIFPYQPKSLGKAFYQATRLLGIENLHFHDLRHEAISRLFERGYAIHEVALFSLHQDW